MFICNEHLSVQNFMELVLFVSIMEFKYSKVLNDQLNVYTFCISWISTIIHVSKDCIPPDVLLVTEKGDVSITSLPELTGACVWWTGWLSESNVKSSTSPLCHRPFLWVMWVSCDWVMWSISAVLMVMCSIGKECGNYTIYVTVITVILKLLTYMYKISTSYG